jgi:TetR/AcrR family transcriptional regulator, transcriptional repressor for nem operon
LVSATIGINRSLVRESVAAALEDQSNQLRRLIASRGLEAAIAVYLSAAHPDNPGKGCASAALLPELARQPPETRQLYTEHFLNAGAPSIGCASATDQRPREPGVGHLCNPHGRARAGPCRDALSHRILGAGADARALSFNHIRINPMMFKVQLAGQSRAARSSRPARDPRPVRSVRQHSTDDGL